jgi:hypothetical protein
MIGRANQGMYIPQQQPNYQQQQQQMSRPSHQPNYSQENPIQGIFLLFQCLKVSF